MKFRGHKMYERHGRFIFTDTGEPTDTTWEGRPCGYCGKDNTPEGHDGCLGTLPCVMNACCGHGGTNDAYIQFTPRLIVRGRLALWIAWVLRWF